MVKIQKNVSLKDFSNFKIGGTARYFLKVKSIDDLISGLKEWKNLSEKKNKKIFILGDGTNILFSDKDFEGLIIHNKIEFLKEKDSGIIEVGSGVLISDLLDFCIKNSLSGLEWAGGLPGTIGGAVKGNAGAFGGEIKDSVVEVKSLNCNDVLIHHYKYDGKIVEIRKRENKDCEFSYRDSVFKTGSGRGEIIISTVFRLKQGNRNEIKNKIEEKITYRKNRHPLEYPNVGSIFKNVPLSKVPGKVQEEFLSSIKNDPFPVMPSAKLIAASNLKGERVGDAQVSEKHPNFIVNLGNAKAKEVLALIKIIKRTIKEKFGVELEEEITIL